MGNADRGRFALAVAVYVGYYRSCRPSALESPLAGCTADRELERLTVAIPHPALKV